jgi:hypothetical protein
MRRLVFLTLLGLTACGGQTPECKKYVDCANAVSEGAGDAVASRYGTDGTCWKASDQEAEACTRACKAAVQSVVDSDPNAPAACK